MELQDGAFVQEEKPCFPVKDIKVDLDIQKKDSVVKLTHGASGNCKSPRCIVLKDKKPFPKESWNKESNINIMYKFQNDQCKVFGAELNPTIVTSVPSPVYSPNTTLYKSYQKDQKDQKEGTDNTIKSFSELEPISEQMKFNNRKLMKRSNLS